jgi:hypothetical protein
MKNRNIPYYMAVLALAAGMSTSFVSCVDTEEPDSIVTLRNAKAEEVKAEAEYQRALAAVQNAQAEVLVAQKSIAAAEAKKAEYEAEYENLKNAHQKAVWAADEAERAIDLANKEAASETEKQLALADAKLKLEQKNKELADAVNQTAVAAAGYANAIAEATKNAEIAARKMKLYGTKDNNYQTDVDNYITAGRTLTKALNKLNTALTVLKGDQAVLEADVTEGKELLQEAKDAKQAFIDQMKDADVTKWVELYRAQETIIDNAAPAKNQAKLDLDKKNEEKKQKYDRPLQKLEDAETEANFVLKTTLDKVQAQIAEFEDDKNLIEDFKLEFSNDVLKAYLDDVFGTDGDFKVEDAESDDYDYQIVANVATTGDDKWTNKTFFEGKKEDEKDPEKVTTKSPVVELKALFENLHVDLDEEYYNMVIKVRKAGDNVTDETVLKAGLTAKDVKDLRKAWTDAIAAFKTATKSDDVLTKFDELKTAATNYFGFLVDGKYPLLQEPVGVSKDAHKLSIDVVVVDQYQKSIVTGLNIANLDENDAFNNSPYSLYVEALWDAAEKDETPETDQYDVADSFVTGKDAEDKELTDGNNIPAIVKAFEDAYAKAQKEATEAEYEFKYKADETAEDKFVVADDGTTEVKIKLADAQKAADDATAEVDKFEADNKTYKEEADKKIAELEDALVESNEVKMAKVIKSTIEGNLYENKSNVYDLLVEKPKKDDKGEWDTGDATFTAQKPTDGKTITEVYDATYESVIEAYDELIEDIEDKLADVEDNLANFESAVAAGKDGKFDRINIATKADGKAEIEDYQDLLDHLNAVKDIINGKEGVNDGKSLEGLQEAYDEAKQKYEDDMALLNGPKDDTTSK